MWRTHTGIMLAVAVSLFAAVAVVATAEAPAPVFVNDLPNESWGNCMSEQGFDLQGCQDDCRQRYGYELYWHRGRPGGAVTPGYWLFARCIQRCNRVHWDVFDKEMDELGKE